MERRAGPQWPRGRRLRRGAQRGGTGGPRGAREWGRPRVPRGCQTLEETHAWLCRGDAAASRGGEGPGAARGEPRGACLPHPGLREVHGGASAEQGEFVPVDAASSVGEEASPSCGRRARGIHGGGPGPGLSPCSPRRAGRSQGPSGWTAGLPPPGGARSIPQGPARPPRAPLFFRLLTLHLGPPALRGGYHEDRAQPSASTPSRPGPARACFARSPGRWTRPSPQSAL